MTHAYARLLLATLTAAGVTAALAVAAPAAQAVSAPILVEADSGTPSSTDNQSAIARCPAGTKVYGAGANVVIESGEGGDVVVDDVDPDSSLTSVDVSAYENDGFSGTWRVIAQAICGPPVANLQRVRAATTQRIVAAEQTITATCPAGTKLYGTGAALDNALGDVFWEQITPSAGLTSLTVKARTNGSLARGWRIFADAICGSPAATMTRVSQTATADSVTPKSVSTGSCPAGTRLHGLGGATSGGGGNVLMEDLRTTSAALVAGSSVKAYENDPTTANWSVTTYGICSS